MSPHKSTTVAHVRLVAEVEEDGARRLAAVGRPVLIGAHVVAQVKLALAVWSMCLHKHDHMWPSIINHPPSTIYRQTLNIYHPQRFQVRTRACLVYLLTDWDDENAVGR